METAREKFLSCLRHQFPQEQSADEMKHLLGTIKRRQNKKNELHYELGRVNYGACSSSNEPITQEEEEEEEEEKDTLYDFQQLGIPSSRFNDLVNYCNRANQEKKNLIQEDLDKQEQGESADKPL